MEEADKAVLLLIGQEVLEYNAIEKTLDAEIADGANLAAERDRVQARSSSWMRGSDSLWTWPSRARRVSSPG